MTARGHVRTAIAAAGLVAIATGLAAAEVRVITGRGIPVLPRTEQPPQRIDPPAKPEPPVPATVTRRFAPVTVEDAATLVVGSLRLIQPGVAPIERDTICRDEAGVDWPCGRRLLAALRGLVKVRPMDCEVPEGVKRGRVETTCRLDGVDFGDVAVRHGWARAVPGGPYGAAEEEARSMRRGVFGAAPPPPTASPELAADPPADLPMDVTLAPLGTGEAGRPAAETTTAPARGAPMPLGR